ncbi:MAG: spheroidene monooxygenase [Paracoccaceae bacterium]
MRYGRGIETSESGGGAARSGTVETAETAADPRAAPAVSLSVFRFDGLGPKLWAFAQMPLARAPLARIPDLRFFKLFGTGGGESFRPRPNPAVWAILTAWPCAEIARTRLASEAVFRRWRDRAVEHLTVHLEPVRVRGAWDGRAPFAVPPGAASEPLPLAVLTRASIKPWKARAFWRDAPAIDDQTAHEPAILFKIGMGEVPWLRQVTFSIWSDADAMRRFAYAAPQHREAIAHVRAGDWFSEELFARFRVTGAEGRWLGRAPLPD